MGPKTNPENAQNQNAPGFRSGVAAVPNRQHYWIEGATHGAPWKSGHLWPRSASQQRACANAVSSAVALKLA
jgi:hypothetical protein